MENVALLESQIQLKKMYSLLAEVMDLTGQMAQAADRGDEVSLQMLIDMREEPIHKLQAVRAVLKEQRKGLPPEEGQHLADLLNGAPSQLPEESAFVNQVLQVHQMWEKVIAFDRRLSCKMNGEDSIYK